MKFPLKLFSGLICAAILFLSLFLLRPAYGHYTFPAYELETDSAPAGGSAFRWKIHVSGLERAERKVKFPKDEMLRDIMAEFLEVHRSAGPMVSHWLASHTYEEITGKVKLATGREASPGVLQQDVHVRFLGAGWQKRTYLVEFSLAGGGAARLVLKIPKGKPESFERELRYHMLLMRRGFNAVPRLAEVVREPGRFFYLEEFIEGKKLADMRAKNEVSVEVRKEVLENLIAIYKETGSIPAGIRPKQFILRQAAAGAPKPVLIDMGGQPLSAPAEVIDQLDMWYGMEGRGTTSRSSPFGGFAQWGRVLGRQMGGKITARDTLIFSGIEEAFGREDGRAILREALNGMSERKASRFRFTHDDFEPFFRGETRLEKYANLLTRRLREHLSQVDRQAEYQHLKIDLAAYLAVSN